MSDILISRAYRCDRCPSEATVVQAKYRGNADDRIGPRVLFLCDAHADPNVPSDRLVLNPHEFLP